MQYARQPSKEGRRAYVAESDRQREHRRLAGEGLALPELALCVVHRDVPERRIVQFVLDPLSARSREQIFVNRNLVS
jgi:hypothetical protein